MCLGTSHDNDAHQEVEGVLRVPGRETGVQPSLVPVLLLPFTCLPLTRDTGSWGCKEAL